MSLNAKRRNGEWRRRGGVRGAVSVRVSLALVALMIALGVAMVAWHPWVPGSTGATGDAGGGAKTVGKTGTPEKTAAGAEAQGKRITLSNFNLRDGQTTAYSVDYESRITLDLGAAVAGMTGAEQPAGSKDGPPEQTIVVKLGGHVVMGFEAPGRPGNPSKNWLVRARFVPGGAGTPDEADDASAAGGKDETQGPVVKTHDAPEAPDGPDAAGQTLPIVFTFQLSARGVVSALRLPPDAKREEEGALAAVLEAMQTALPARPETSWRLSETCRIGDYRGEYRVEDMKAATGSEPMRWVVSKHRRDMRIRNTGKEKSNLTIRMKRSDGTVGVSTGEGWVDAVALDEELEHLSSGKLTARLEHRVRARRASLQDGVTAPTAAEVMQAMSVPAPNSGATNPALDAVTLRMSMSDALLKFQSGYTGDYPAARDLLLNWLRQKPERAKELVDWLTAHGRELPEDVELALWRMVANSGTKASQDALLSVLTSESAPELARYRAAAHLGEMTNARSETVDRLWEFVHSHQSAQEGTARELASAALYAIGALGHESRGNPALGASIAAQLAVELRAATGEKDTLRVLDAIGNQGADSLLKPLEPMLADENGVVRAAALRAMRRMDSDAAVAALTARYAVEADIRVKAAAVGALAEMPPRESGLAWARAEAAKLPDERLAVPLVDLLGKTSREHPENERALRALLEQPLTPKTKRAIYKHIPVTPGQGKGRRTTG